MKLTQLIFVLILLLLAMCSCAINQDQDKTASLLSEHAISEVSDERILYEQIGLQQLNKEYPQLNKRWEIVSLLRCSDSNSTVENLCNQAFVGTVIRFSPNEILFGDVKYTEKKVSNHIQSLKSK